MSDKNFTVGDWRYDSENTTLLNTRHGTWELELQHIHRAHDLLFWIMQAAQHGFNMTDFLNTLGKAAQLRFETIESNPVIALKKLYDIEPSKNARREIDWEKGLVVER